MNKSLSEKDNQELLVKFLAGDEEARGKLIEGNLGLVYWIVKRLGRRSQKYKAISNDLVGEGSLALIKAVDTLGNRTDQASIATYLRRSVEHSLHNFIDRDGPITMPDRTQRKQRHQAYIHLQPTVRFWRDGGVSYSEIARRLNSEGYRTTRGTEFTAVDVERIIDPKKRPRQESEKVFNHLAAPDETAAVDMRDLIMSCAECGRQREMLELLEAGYTFRQIAKQLHVSIRAVFLWRNAIYSQVKEKAGLKDQVEDD